MNHRTRALVGLLCIAGLATGQLNQNYRPEFFSPGQGFQSVSAQISSSNVQQFKRQAPGGGGAGGADVIPHDQKKQTTFWWVAPDTPFKATKIGGGVQHPPGTDGEDGAAGGAGTAAGAGAVVGAGGVAGSAVSQTSFTASAARTATGQAGQAFGAGGTTTSIKSSTASRTIGSQTQGFQGTGAAGTLGTTRSTISKSSSSSTFGSQPVIGQQGVIAGTSRTSSTTTNTRVNTGTVQPGVGAGGVSTSTIIQQSKTQTSTGVAPVPVPAPPPPSTSITTTGLRTDTITSNVNSPVPRTTVDISKQTNVDTRRIQTNLYPGQPGSTSTSTVVGTATTTGLTPNNYGGTTVTKTQERSDDGITSKVITTGTITRPFYKQTTSTSRGYDYPVPETIPCYEPNKICAPNQFCNDGFVDESQLNLFNTNNQVSENCNSATEQCCKIRPTPATRCPDDSYVCVSPSLCNNGLLNFDAQNAISTRQP
uniref:Uncharacterized protein n=1 Tax=Anopheles minimus TaxID=112268 RepID=A0A182W759_9DIPT